MKPSIIPFTYSELLALNKLLGKVKFASSLSAADLHHFSMSPFTVSAMEKIHKAYFEQFRMDMKRRQITRVPKAVTALDPEKDFYLNEYHSISGIRERMQLLDEEHKLYIRSLNEQKMLDYCALIFAPFIPTSEQQAILLELLKSI